MGSRLSRRAPESSDLFPKVRDRVHFLWTQSHSPLLHRLSSNIVREISLYLGNKIRLIVAYDREIVLFDVSSHKSEVINLQRKIEVNFDSSATFIGTDKVFVCAGGMTRRNPKKSVYVIDSKGLVKQQPGMITSRGYFGMVYDRGNMAVYVFGGVNDAMDTRLRSGEKFLLDCSKWKKLPDMHYVRYGFNPCINAFIVYLCGGFSSTIETYSPQTNIISVLSDFSLFQDTTSCIALVESECLVVISQAEILKWHFGQKQVSFRDNRTGFCYSSRCTPVIRDGLVYVVNGAICRGFEARSGNLETQLIV